MTLLKLSLLDRSSVEAKQKAEEMLSSKTSAFEYAKAEAELAQAIAQLRAIEKLRKQMKKIS